ncbi:hydroxymethylglutaryl-CoA synthase family protein [Burkholderia gladioli]|uniref:hydroxymethylglutaryl-CoA synthase family protein n=1 Tax=Burkholderia gladioli TaxID=28095 RepID=UPI001641617B|nr:hydroxymethylglutaryl-CoA synthase family protein [Burkholderia gladioli]
MMSVGIEAINVFGGTACIDVGQLARHRGLDTGRFQGLLISEKSVALPFEDPVTFGANAARPIVDALSPAERDRIEMLITCTESGIDFGKSLSTYLHHHLGLNRNCRLFEIKQACYSGTAGLQTAVNFVLSQVSPGAKVLVVATDIARYALDADAERPSDEWAFAEPTAGAGAVAILVSEQPRIFQIDVGASGCYGYEVMDTCRPAPDMEAGDADLSLLSYLDCCENAYAEYRRRVQDVDYARSFHYLAFHTPFGGMVKGAHRTMMRKFAGAKPAEIEADFERRVAPGLAHCRRVGNIMGATVLMSLASTVDHGDFARPARIGYFSYGSGCCSEFLSGVVRHESQMALAPYRIRERLDARHALTMSEYDYLLRGNGQLRFGTRDIEVDDGVIEGTRRPLPGFAQLRLRAIHGFHREYEWLT